MAHRWPLQPLCAGCICHSQGDSTYSGCSHIRLCHRHVVQKAEAQTEQTPHHKDETQQAEAAAAARRPSLLHASPATWP